MFRKIISITIIALCLVFIGCGNANEPPEITYRPPYFYGGRYDDIDTYDPTIYEDAPYRNQFLYIVYKGERHCVAANMVCLSIKAEFHNSELLDKLEKSGYEIVTSKPKYSLILVRTDGKQHILAHYYKFEKEEYVKEVLPYEAFVAL
jgi:hypothetical protein